MPINALGDHDNAHPADAVTNTDKPAPNARRPPITSAIRPPTTSRPPNVSVYAVITHDRSASAKTQRGADHRQRGGHDRHIQHDHELRNTDHGEGGA